MTFEQVMSILKDERAKTERQKLKEITDYNCMIGFREMRKHRVKSLISQCGRDKRG